MSIIVINNGHANRHRFTGAEIRPEKSDGIGSKTDVHKIGLLSGFVNPDDPRHSFNEGMRTFGTISCHVAKPFRSASACAGLSSDDPDRSSHMSPQDFHPPGSPSRSALRWRMQRGCFNANRLRYEASILASVHGAVCLGQDKELSDLLNDAGLGNDSVSTIRFRGFAGEVGVVLPTDRTWNQPRLLDTAFDVGSKASSVAKTVMIVPPADVRRQPRLGNSQTIYHDKKVPAYGDADAAKACIEAKGGRALLLECAAALRGPDARERVLGLVYGGQLTLDLAEALSNRSIVGLFEPHTPRLWDALGWKPVPEN